jgi:hypothetical protein
MKNLKYLLAPIVIYLAGAFINWNLNAGEWTEAGRYFCAVFSLGGMLAHIGFNETNNP